MKPTPYEIETNDSGLDPYDVIEMKSGSGIILRKIKNGHSTIYKVYPWKQHKYRIVNFLKFLWLRIGIKFGWI